MKRIFKRKILVPVFAIVLLVTTTAFKNDFFEIAKQIEIFTTLYKELNMNYVDETNPGELMDTAIKSMLNDLDPYTRFHNEQDVESYKINNSGEYTGVGAGIRRQNGRLFITEPYKDYPADKAGLKAGDEIIQVGDIRVADSKEETSAILKGAPNSKVDVVYKRQGKEYKTSITRSSVQVDAVPFYKMVDDKTGYIVLQKFNSKAFSQTKQALIDLKAEGASQLILDLRGNPGGLLRESIRIVNLFVPKGEVIVTTKSKEKKYNRIYKTQEEPLDVEIPLVVLVNGRSASASEIVSGSLQDLDRAVVIGSRSFGKGLVQRTKKLTYGTQLKVTISRYYTPSGRCIQALDYWNRDEKGNAVKTKEENFNEFKTKNGRTVYDGGGINPDVLIENEQLSNISKSLTKDHIIFDFCTEFYFKNKFDNLEDFTFTSQDYKSFKTFVSSSGYKYETATEKALLKLEAQSDVDNINLSNELKSLKEKIEVAKREALNENESELSNLIKEQLVTRYFYRQGLYEYNLKNNPTILRAKTVLNTKEFDKILK